jgi:hypothetical protein
MDNKTGEPLDAAAKARQLAEAARRIADLVHQVQVRRDLLAQATSLEREAEALERKAAG